MTPFKSSDEARKYVETHDNKEMGFEIEGLGECRYADDEIIAIAGRGQKHWQRDMMRDLEDVSKEALQSGAELTSMTGAWSRVMAKERYV